MTFTRFTNPAHNPVDPDVEAERDLVRGDDQRLRDEDNADAKAAEIMAQKRAKQNALREHMMTCEVCRTNPFGVCQQAVEMFL